jgi:hypothetical protein
MKQRSGRISPLAVSLAIALGGVCRSAEPVVGTAPDNSIPAEIAAMLKEHLGSWRAEGRVFDGVTSKSMDATWECKPAVGGPGNVCTWNHQTPDLPPDAIEIMGYNSNLKAMSITRLNDQGVINTVSVTVRGNVMTRHWESMADGKTTSGDLEIVVKSPGEWEQHITTETDGKRTSEWSIRHHRIK